MYFNLFGKLSPELRSNTTAVSECPLQEKSMGLEALFGLPQKKIKTKGTLFSNRYFTHITEQQMFEHW